MSAVMNYQYTEGSLVYYNLTPKRGTGWLVDALCPEYALAKVVCQENKETFRKRIFCVEAIP